MTKKLTPRVRFICTGIVTLLIWAHLGWDYFHGGVPTHHIRFIEHSPGISNWWGGLVLPLLTWFLLGRIQKRVNLPGIDKPEENHIPKSILFGFAGALLLGISISIFFTYGNTFIPRVMMLTLIPLAFFIPMYRAEYLLGFIFGMTYTFGPILPIGIGVVLMILFAITYKYIRSGILFIASTIRGKD